MADIVIENEREMKVERPPIRAFIDSIVEIDGVKAIVEIKSTRDESFVHRKYSGTPMAYHLYQLLLYMYFEKIDQFGGMVEAVEAGFPQREIWDAAYQYQRSVDSGEKLVVGVNAFKMEQEDPYDALYIDPTTQTAAKCNYCAHRVEVGLEPACLDCGSHRAARLAGVPAVAEAAVAQAEAQVEATEIELDRLVVREGIETRLRQLARLEAIKIEQELASLRTEQGKLEEILNSPATLKRTVIKEIEADAKQYGDDRRTLIEVAERAVLATLIATTSASRRRYGTTNPRARLRSRSRIATLLRCETETFRWWPVVQRIPSSSQKRPRMTAACTISWSIPPPAAKDETRRSEIHL